MRYKPGYREEARKRILGAMGRGFRKHGYEGIGVDGLAKEAGVTSGAFYGHFSSKEEAFKEVVVYGINELREGIAFCQAQYGAGWVEAFVDYYLGHKRTCDLTEACALQTLTSEVVRSSEVVRKTYQDELEKVVEIAAKGLPHGTLAERRDQAWALLSLLSGGVTTARAIVDGKLPAKIAKALRSAALAIAQID